MVSIGLVCYWNFTVTKEETLTPAYSKEFARCWTKEDNDFFSADGMVVEHYNQRLEEYLKKVVSASQENWEIKLALFLVAYRLAAIKLQSRVQLR